MTDSGVSPAHCALDADELASQASALAIRDQSSAVARVLGSAAGE